MTIEDLKRGHSKIRNRAIATAFREIRLMERFGTAWAKIQNDLEAGYPEPTFDDDSPAFKATLWAYPMSERAPTASDSGSHTDQRRRRAGDERRAEIMDAIRGGGGLGSADVAALLGVTDRQARRLLTAMGKDGLVVATGEGPQRRYVAP